MELELQKEHFDCYLAGTPLCEKREETAETIVPDYSPDISRIVDVSACLLVREQSASDGKLTVSGAVKLSLLYMTEDAPGLRAMEYAVPFEHTLDGRFPDADGETAVEGRVCGAEARLLNPRKIFTKLELLWRATPYRKSELVVCGGIEEQEKYAIETLCEQHKVSLITAAGAKDFLFSDELTLPGGREAIRELLCHRVKLRVTESRSVGSKIVVKGVVCLSLLYRSDEEKLCSYAEELPFSQIFDGAEGENDAASAAVKLLLRDCEVHIGAEGVSSDGRTVSLRLLLSAFLTQRRTETVCCITDLYSTSYALSAQLDPVELQQEPEAQTLQQHVREQLDTGTEVQCVLSADVCFGAVTAQTKGEQTTVRTTVSVKALYLDEAGIPFAVERRAELSAEAVLPDCARVDAEAVCNGDITANINANGIELRFPADFTLVSQGVVSCPCLTSLSAEEDGGSGAEAPSLVLRGIEAGQQLWDVAKQYRTTVEDILAANELTDGADALIGQMLLIPRKR